MFGAGPGISYVVWVSAGVSADRWTRPVNEANKLPLVGSARLEKPFCMPQKGGSSTHRRACHWDRADRAGGLVAAREASSPPPCPAYKSDRGAPGGARRGRGRVSTIVRNWNLLASPSAHASPKSWAFGFENATLRVVHCVATPSGRTSTPESEAHRRLYSTF